MYYNIKFLACPEWTSLTWNYEKYHSSLQAKWLSQIKRNIRKLLSFVCLLCPIKVKRLWPIKVDITFVNKTHYVQWHCMSGLASQKSLFMLPTKKTSMISITGTVWGEPLVTGEFPLQKRFVMQKMFRSYEVTVWKEFPQINGLVQERPHFYQKFWLAKNQSMNYLSGITIR